ncbi:MAG: SLC13 family permease, partial [Thermofilaceae archaeon]
MLDPRPYLLSYVLTITLSLSGLFSLSLSAIIGAALTVLFGVNDRLFTFEEALTFIDLDLITLLIGVMIVAEVIDRSGLFRLLAIKLIKRTQSKPKHLLVIVPLFAAIVSLLVSDEAALLLSAAILISISRILGIDPKPVALSAAVMVNLGGTGTLIGSIPNMAIGLRAGLDFIEFATYILPCEFMLYGVTLAYLFAIFKDKVPSEIAVLPDIREEVDIREVVKGAFILAFMLTTLVFSSFLGSPASVAALASAVLALAICGYDTTEVFRELDWDTVFFTAAFNVIVEVLSEAEALQGLSQLLHT